MDGVAGGILGDKYASDKESMFPNWYFPGQMIKFLVLNDLPKTSWKVPHLAAILAMALCTPDTGLLFFIEHLLTFLDPPRIVEVGRCTRGTPRLGV